PSVAPHFQALPAPPDPRDPRHPRDLPDPRDPSALPDLHDPPDLRDPPDPSALLTVVRAGLERAALADAFRDVDAVVHLAGVVSAIREQELFHVNVEGTRAVADAARAAGVRLIHVSSLAAAGPASAGHPRPATGRQLLEGVRSAVGRPARIVRVPMALARVAAIAGDIGGAIRGRPLPLNGTRYVELSAEGFVCRVDRLRDCLGIVAEVDLAQGLAQTAAWYRQKRWL